MNSQGASQKDPSQHASGKAGYRLIFRQLEAGEDMLEMLMMPPAVTICQLLLNLGQLCGQALAFGHAFAEIMMLAQESADPAKASYRCRVNIIL